MVRVEEAGQDFKRAKPRHVAASWKGVTCARAESVPDLQKCHEKKEKSLPLLHGERERERKRHRVRERERERDTEWERGRRREQKVSTSSVLILKKWKFFALSLSLCLSLCVSLSWKLKLQEAKTIDVFSGVVPCSFFCPKVVELREDARVWHMIIHTCAFLFLFVWPFYPKKSCGPSITVPRTQVCFLLWISCQDERWCAWLFSVCMVVLPFLSAHI